MRRIIEWAMTHPQWFLGIILVIGLLWYILLGGIFLHFIHKYW